MSFGCRYEPNKFRLRSNSPIAEGGFGEVWEAWHEERYERVAIKILRRQVTQQ